MRTSPPCTVGIVAILLLCAAPGSTARAQETGAPVDRFAETVEVEVVNVDVVVVDRQGQPVVGLGPADFRIFEDGEPREITNFYASEGAAQAFERHRAGDRVAAPEEASPGQVRRIAILFDTNTLVHRDRNRAVEAAERFVSEKFDGSYEWAVIAYGDDVRVMQPFTADKIAVVNALAEVKRLSLPQRRTGGPSDFLLSEDAASARIRQRVRAVDTRGSQGVTMQDFEVRERVLENLRTARKTAAAAVNTMRAYGRLPGRKSLILVSGVLENLPTPSQLLGGGFPGASQDQDRADPMLITLQQELQTVLGAMVQTANAAGFSIYPMSALGLVDPTAPHHDIERKNSPYLDSFGAQPTGQDVESSPRLLADGTGGRFFQSTKYYEAFHEIDASTANAYVLGFRTVRPPDRRYHRIRVEVNQPGLEARAREGYLHLSTADRLLEELSTPLVFPKEQGEIPVHVSVAPTTPAETDERLVTVSGAIPVREITLLPQGERSYGRVQIYLAVYDAEGRLMDIIPNTQDVQVESDRIDQVLATGEAASFALKVRLKPGTYTFSMTLMDQVSSRFGTALERRAI
jgi:VWFA-related protein